MDEPIEETYFNWLYSKVAAVPVPTPSLTFYTLLRDLHATEFVWMVTGDDSRAQDGLDLRRQFLREAFLKQDPAWMSIPCSVLEMLIAFAMKAEFETDIHARQWFWEFLDNLGISHLSDAEHRVSEKINEGLNDFVWRTYQYNGQGGLFPLRNPAHDQRKVEIWYQFCEYLVDQERL